MLDKVLLFLASKSPRRRKLLSLGNWEFQVIPANVDETPEPGETPQDYVLRTAVEKAEAVAEIAPNNVVIIAADTTVADEQGILGKPEDPRAAVGMLTRLRGRSHQVYTGLAVLQMNGRVLHTDICTTQVPMRAYSEQEMKKYIASGDPFDKAGGYAIQHKGFHPVDNLEGCYANVVGLPLCHLTRMLLQLEIKPETDIPGRCQEELGYQCPVYNQILQGKL